MEEKTNEQQPKCLPKLPTGIRGFDKVLYGGIDANVLNPLYIKEQAIERTPLVIVIRGNEDENDKCMLAMQMLYGIAQSIENIKSQYPVFGEDWNNEPIMYSTYYQAHKLDDLFLDFFISSSLQEILRKKASKDTSVNLSSNIFTDILFDSSQILCQGISRNANIPYSAIANKTDAMIGDGIIYYNRRTNSLHVKANLTADDNKYNQVYLRRFDSINEYSQKYHNKQQDALFYKYTGLHFLPFEMIGNLTYGQLTTSIANPKELIAVDLSAYKDLAVTKINSLLNLLHDAKIVILVVDSTAEIPENRVNMMIELSQKVDHKFVLKYLQITKSDSQDFAPGLHQYKKRDYGIEVYPRKELYLYERRYLQRALVYTHADAVTETYQQYMKLQKYYIDTPTTTYEDYEADIASEENKPFYAIYPKNYMEQMSIDLLNRVFIPINPLRNLLHKSKNETEFIENEYMYGNAGFVTAVIGKANTYKRFLTFGGIFGSACAEDHTLIIMMNKEEMVTRRRLACPARPLCGDRDKACRSCYHYIHFMNICMGNITPEEFLYYLERQIEVTYDGDQKKHIRRIVIDDLQILDFCFPRLNDGLFLAALAELCREHDIILYILCDISGKMLPPLRALADNVIITQKDKKDGHPLIFVEKFAGYTNTPSKMYCGKVKNVYKLFRCVEKDGINSFELQTNIVELEDMDENQFMN